MMKHVLVIALAVGMLLILVFSVGKAQEKSMPYADARNTASKWSRSSTLNESYHQQAAVHKDFQAEEPCFDRSVSQIQNKIHGSRSSRKI